MAITKRVSTDLQETGPVQHSYQKANRKIPSLTQ